MRTARKIGAIGVALFAASGALRAQREGHTMGSTGDADACVTHSKESLQIIERADRRLEEARQTNNPTRMRAAMDELQEALGELKTHQSLCIDAGASQPPPAGHEMEHGASEPKKAAPEDHAKMGHDAPGVPSPKAPEKPPPSGPSAGASKTAIDPVCGMEVDRATAPKLTYEGQTYYFCSAADKERFAKDTRNYVKP
jgi:YHS domain-containing protein